MSTNTRSPLSLPVKDECCRWFASPLKVKQTPISVRVVLNKFEQGFKAPFHVQIGSISSIVFEYWLRQFSICSPLGSNPFTNPKPGVRRSSMTNVSPKFRKTLSKFAKTVPLHCGIVFLTIFMLQIVTAGNSRFCLFSADILVTVRYWRKIVIASTMKAISAHVIRSVRSNQTNLWRKYSTVKPNYTAVKTTKYAEFICSLSKKRWCASEMWNRGKSVSFLFAQIVLRFKCR